VIYEGQIYNTIQIFSQCWLKENLNVGAMIHGSEEMTNNGILEKYCYENEPDSCIKYGGLYQWGEMMQYTTQQGATGICPLGWHLPTDEEWKLLEGAADSHYGIGELEWDAEGNRGYDAGTNLKNTSGWVDNGNGTDLYGFSGLPAGIRHYYVDFSFVGYDGYWWTSTEFSQTYATYRILNFWNQDIYRNYLLYYKEDGFSVRCLRDD
jgi:uncharacterized protein (TIGR02145 family)